MATRTAYNGNFRGFQKKEAVPFFVPKSSISRPLSGATDILEDSDHDDEFDYPEDSPFTSVVSFRTGSASTVSTLSTISTASTPNDATTPDSTGLTAFDFQIDDKIVKGPLGPHLFSISMESSDYMDSALQDRPPSAVNTYYQSASKLDPVRRDTPVPNRVSSTPQPQPQQQQTVYARPDLAVTEADVGSWTPQDVVRWLQTNGIDHSIMETFYVNDISGSILLELQTQDLKELGIQSFGKRHRLMGLIQSLQNLPRPSNVGGWAPQNPIPVREAIPVREVPPTPQTATTVTASDCHSSSTTDEDLSDQKSDHSRRRRHQKSRRAGDLGPGDSISIVAIEQVLPKLHNCSKGENCRKWQKQQIKLADIARDLPLGSVNGRVIVTGDPGNPMTAPNLIKSPKSDITPSLVASSDVMGPVKLSEYQLSQEKLNEVRPRDPQENVRNFLSFQSLSKLQPVNAPATPPRDLLPSPGSESPGSARGNPTLAENLRHLPKLMIPNVDERVESSLFSPDMDMSALRTVTPSMEHKNPYYNQDLLTSIPNGRQQYAYGATVSPGDFYRCDPHYGQGTPFSEVDVPITAIPIGPVSREESQSVPPNMRFGSNRHRMADPIQRPSTTTVGKHRRNTSTQNIPRLAPLDERRVFNPIETPADLEKTPRAPHCRNYSPTSGPWPNDVTHSGWMKKRKTTRLLRHEWEDHHFTLQGTQLAMHDDEESARRHSKALEHIDVDDYAVACSSFASTSKLTAAFKKTVLKRKDGSQDDSAFFFSLIPAPANGSGVIDKKTLFLNSGKSHHFAVKTRDERIDWMRELMLAKALKRGRDSGAAMNVYGNVI